MSFEKLFESIDSIRIENITKMYGNIYAVRDLSLDIVGGELMMLIGPSGSGKTTTLRMINRLIDPDEGRVFINDNDVSNFDPVELRRNIGYVIQQIGLFPHMNVKDNIGIIPKLEGWDNERIENRVRQLLDLVALPSETFMNRYPMELSGGQQQRVGLARALAMDPPLLLMDEPFGALDPILRIQLQEEFINIKEELGKTIIFVTHDIEESFKLGDRIAIMRNAGLEQLGTADDLVLNPSNDFVSEIVDSNNKFKHVNRLIVGDFMLPLEDKYYIGSGVKVKDAITRMCKGNIELAIVLDGRERMIGWTTLGDLYGRGGDERMDDNLKEPILVSRNDRLRGSLEMLKENGSRLAVVQDRGRPVGLLRTDEALIGLL